MNVARADHVSRRERVLAALREQNAALVVAAAPELHVGPDTGLRYLPDADMYWLSGYTEPEAVIVLAPQADKPFMMFVRDRDPDAERWTGMRGGVDAALSEYGADAAFPLTKLANELPQAVAGADRVYARLDAGRNDVRDCVQRTLDAARRSRPRTGSGPHTITEPSVLLGPMRRRKDAHEIALVKEAAAITVAGFAAARAALADARGEWQLEAALEYEFRRRGAMGPAFPSIVAADANATVLHYISNQASFGRDAAVLIDAGARYRMYCGDISRTYPAGGRFTPAQQAVYDVVARAHGAALDACLPGSTVATVHDTAVRVLVEGMIELGLLRGAVDEITAKGEHKRYYPHRTSHWLGLDVHDVGDYVTDAGEPQPLEEGMVLTVEPGLYIPADDERAPREFRGIGVRIEDDVLMTGAGREVLTAGAPY
jgi:Xaa-Pro aminopeptidase